MNPIKPTRLSRDGLRPALAAAVGLALCVAWQAACLATPPNSIQSVKQPVREFRIWNITDEPFHYRLGKTHGRPWSREFTLAPGESVSIREPPSGQESQVVGLSHRGDDFVNIRFPSFGGLVHERLSALSANGRPTTHWFHVKDANGFSELIQAGTLAAAKRRQTEMQQEHRLDAREIEALKRVLRANWVLYVD